MGLFQDSEGSRLLGQSAHGAYMSLHNTGAPPRNTTAPTNGESSSTVQPAPEEEQATDIPLADAEMTEQPEQPQLTANGALQDEAIQNIERNDHTSGLLQTNSEQSSASVLVNGVNITENGIQTDLTAQSEAGATADGSAESIIPDDTSTAPSHRMTTRRQANQNTGTPSPVQFVSPVTQIPTTDDFFNFPGSAVPHPDQGLPSQMADETRIALGMYIQKQEEVVRQLQEMHAGLLKGLKMRNDVHKWAKAEGHVGEMSDNEDWADLEEWGIDPRDPRIQYTKGQQEDDQVDEEEERRAKRVRRAGGKAKE
jgi:hypothetical protein